MQKQETFSSRNSQESKTKSPSTQKRSISANSEESCGCKGKTMFECKLEEVRANIGFLERTTSRPFNWWKHAEA